MSDRRGCLKTVEHWFHVSDSPRAVVTNKKRHARYVWCRTRPPPRGYLQKVAYVNIMGRAVLFSADLMAASKQRRRTCMCSFCRGVQKSRQQRTWRCAAVIKLTDWQFYVGLSRVLSKRQTHRCHAGLVLLPCRYLESHGNSGNGASGLPPSRFDGGTKKKSNTIRCVLVLPWTSNFRHFGVMEALCGSLKSNGPLSNVGLSRVLLRKKRTHTTIMDQARACSGCRNGYS